MDVSAVGSSTSLAGAIAGNQQLGQQEFLKLLITQLTNQDPLSPQDDKQFLAQMAQFATVEGVTRMGSSIGQLQAAALIGKTVDASAPVNGVAQPITGIVTGVRLTSDGARLTVNGAEVGLDQVTQIRDK